MNRFAKFGLLVLAFAAVAGVNPLSAHEPEPWAPREGCGTTINDGDTLWGIGQRHGLTVDQLMAANPWIEHQDRIPRFEPIDICEPGVEVETSSATLTNPEHVRAVEWAEAVIEHAPEGTSQAHIRKMVAVAGPESNFCGNLWNPGDAGAGGWLGSYGCAQIRVHADHAAREEPFRNLEWLQLPGYDQEAIAAWEIYYAPGWGGWHNWGPLRNDPAQLKLHGDCGRVPASRRDACLHYWAVADAALAEVQS